MAKIVRTYLLCDPCLRAGEEVEGSPISDDIPGLPKDGELCKQHRVEIIEPLLTFLAEHGRKPEAPMIPCGHRGCSRDFKSKAARAQHIRQSHQEETGK